ncbi:cysteine-rich receptor-like protein kinase 8 [Tanacetum coccineum]
MYGLPFAYAYVYHRVKKRVKAEFRFLALEWHLEEINVTLAHLEKKRTRLRLYAKNHEEFFGGPCGVTGVSSYTAAYSYHIGLPYLWLIGVIGNVTPYEILLKKKPDYTSLRVFGCLAMVSNPSRTTDKFDLRDPGWCATIDVELKALEENGTWELTALPAGKKAIGSHWIFKTKLKADGTEERNKARLLCRYTKDLLEEGGVLNNKPYKLPMEPNLKLQADVGTPLQDPKVYRRFIGKLIYLTVTRPDICYTVQLLSQFMQSPTSVHMQAVKHLLRYLLNSP